MAGQKQRPLEDLTSGEKANLKRLLARVSYDDVRRLLLDAHLEYQGSKARVARSLGVCEKTIYNWINQLKEEEPEAPKEVKSAEATGQLSTHELHNRH